MRKLLKLKFSRISIAAVAMAVWPLVTPIVALARAGGGQHYGGGGGGGYGGGGFGGDGLWFLLPWLFAGHGSFGGLIAFLVILYVVRQLRSRGNCGSDVLDDGPPVSAGMPAGALLTAPQTRYDPDRVAAGLAAMEQKDANFDERAFLDRAQTSFFKIQQAWAARNQDLARDCMSDALYERHKMQTDQLIANHQIDVLENIVIGSAHIVDVEPGHAFDSITVAFTASMADYTIDEQTRRIVDGDQSQRTFTEYWTFIRRADAKTNVGQTTLAPSCASCGAPLQLERGKCVYCGAYARTTSSDWVVDTIEQS